MGVGPVTAQARMALYELCQFWQMKQQEERDGLFPSSTRHTSDIFF